MNVNFIKIHHVVLEIDLIETALGNYLPVTHFL